MKYRVENQLDLFEYHDSVFSLVSFDKKELVVSVKHLNIHKDTKENPHDCDMEISSANIYFQNIQILSFEPVRAYQLDADGNWYTNEPQIIYQDDEAKENFINALKNGFSINGVDIQRHSECTTFDFDTNSPICFNATFSFSNVIVEWDSYRRKAWYELHTQYRYEITLSTPDGESKELLHVVCNEEDEFHPTVRVSIQYQDQEIWGYGEDYLWVDAFADLQKHLPDNVILKCCLTCRHGNMCPFGNKPGEVFCTKDFVVSSKEDMCNLFGTESNDVIENRSRNYADTCENYKHQSADFYTYNDYLYELNT